MPQTQKLLVRISNGLDFKRFGFRMVRISDIRYFAPNRTFGLRFLAPSQTIIYTYIYNFYLKWSSLVNRTNRTPARSTNQTSKIRTKSFGFRTNSKSERFYNRTKVVFVYLQRKGDHSSIFRNKIEIQNFLRCDPCDAAFPDFTSFTLHRYSRDHQVSSLVFY